MTINGRSVCSLKVEKHTHTVITMYLVSIFILVNFPDTISMDSPFCVLRAGRLNFLKYDDFMS